MLTITTVISTAFNLLTRRRLVKITRFGKNDTQTGIEASPYGTDSNPVKGMRAIYAETASKGEQVIIGYVNKDLLAGVGEHRIFSTDLLGNVVFSVWLKNDGTCQIGGNLNHMTRYEALEVAFNELQAKFNAFAAAYVPGGPTVVGLPPTVAQSTGDITAAKITQVKTF